MSDPALVGYPVSGQPGGDVDSPPPSPEDDARRLQQIGAELTGVEAALRRLDDGTYGTCQVCGVPLDPGLLASAPMAARCPQH